MLVSKQDVEDQERYFLPHLGECVFIHPTDNYYAIGCDATNSNLVMRLRILKRWQTQPFTIIAPSKQWILENIDVPEEALERLPGPVTLIARMKNNSCVCHDVHLGYKTLGVRIPDHWISSVVAKIGVPIVTTCANKYAQDLMTCVETADPHLVEAAKFVLHEGPKQGQQTLFIDYSDTQVIPQ